jgi:hypothetical protein
VNRATFLLGLPALREGVLWATARALDAPVLVSANALSQWAINADGYRMWTGFNGRALKLVHSHPVALDSAGFVAACRYRGFPWETEDYLDLAAAAPWIWWASQDWCVEPEAARDEDAVLDRISGTVRLNTLCLNGARRRGSAHNFVPVIQGWRPEHYLRCIDRMPFVLDCPLIGIGSMCRRHVGGPNGIIRVLEALDSAFAGTATRFHLFGLKSQGIQHAAMHPRVASCDSQAYGMAARQDAWKARAAKSDRYVAGIMRRWYEQQLATMRTTPSRPGLNHAPPPESPARLAPHEARIRDAYEELRALHEAGELSWSQLSPQHAYEMAFLDE